MSLRDLVYEVEDLELDVRIIQCIFDVCYERIAEQTEEQAEYIIAGLSRSIYDLSKKMEQLKEKGFKAIAG